MLPAVERTCRVSHHTRPNILSLSNKSVVFENEADIDLETDILKLYRGGCMAWGNELRNFIRSRECHFGVFFPTEFWSNGRNKHQNNHRVST